MTILPNLKKIHHYEERKWKWKIIVVCGQFLFRIADESISFIVCFFFHRQNVTKWKNEQTIPRIVLIGFHEIRTESDNKKKEHSPACTTWKNSVTVLNTEKTSSLCVVLYWNYKFNIESRSTCVCVEYVCDCIGGRDERHAKQNKTKQKQQTYVLLHRHDDAACSCVWSALRCIQESFSIFREFFFRIHHFRAVAILWLSEKVRRNRKKNYHSFLGS